MDLTDLQKLLERASQNIPKQALTVIGVEGKNFINKNFKEQGFTDTSTTKWKHRKVTDSNARSIIRYRTNRKGKAGSLNQYGQNIKGRALLVGFDTGGNKLKKSFKHRISLGSNTVSFYTAKEYAQRHNEGLDGMPKRQFMGKSNYLNEQIGKKVSKELDKIFK